MTIGKGRALRLSLLLLAVLALGVILKEAVAPRLLRRKLIAAVQGGCATCTLSLGQVRISLLPLAVSGAGVRFTGGTPNATVVNCEARRVYVPFALFPLLKGRLRAGRIEIDQPAVTVTEGDLHVPPSAGGAPPDLEIEGAAVKDGSFVYVRERPGRTGRLGVTRINAVLGPAGSSDRLKDADVEASADGLLEKSGQFQLQIRAKFLAKTPDTDVKLQINGQNLAELNPFLKPDDGIQLRGTILEGRSTVKVRGAGLRASAYVRYRGLGVKIKQNKGRSGLSAFFQSLVASVTIGKQNSDGGHYDRFGAADLRRKPKETVISFILRGMKVAAMEVSSKGSRGADLR